MLVNVLIVWIVRRDFEVLGVKETRAIGQPRQRSARRPAVHIGNFFDEPLFAVATS